MNKDVGLSVDYARSQGIAVPVANLLGQVFQAMMNQGNGEKDYTVISRWVEQQNADRA
jgi:3-hydroxyisobutyrate dehydrogenase-like beta-hydroxyacid dehydrogenase